MKCGEYSSYKDRDMHLIKCGLGIRSDVRSKFMGENIQ
jgi:hypothetical protein